MLTKDQFTGQRNEMAQIGLYFYNARWYDPSIMRWISPDAIVPGVGEGGDPNAVGCLSATNYSPLTVDYHENQLLEQLNLENRTRLQDHNFKLPPVPTNSIAFDRYAYSLNNPIRYTDPSGHCPLCIALALTFSSITPVGWVIIGVGTVGVVVYYAAGGPEVVTNALDQAGDFLSNETSKAVDKITSISLADKLPKKGQYVYVPPKVKGNPGYVRVPGGGFKDKDGNIWRRDHSGHYGGDHWDVEHPDGSHTVVDDNGKILKNP